MANLSRESCLLVNRCSRLVDFVGSMNSLRDQVGEMVSFGLSVISIKDFRPLCSKKDAGTRLDAGTLTGFRWSIADKEKRSRCFDE